MEVAAGELAATTFRTDCLLLCTQRAHMSFQMLRRTETFIASGDSTGEIFGWI